MTSEDWEDLAWSDLYCVEIINSVIITCNYELSV
jgi:hypothetical protein